jgi:peptidoglycan/LPS O-acetylase OafA/YrhL
MPSLEQAHVPQASAGGGKPRDLYIDRLRSVMTALVVLHHTAITYGGAGGWFWREREISGTLSSLLLTLFCATNQAYFMGFFFLLAGYFTPRSLERKGYAGFLRDRMLRLGLPLLAFIVILGPLTAGIATWEEGKGFWPTIAWLWEHRRIINGPLWFAEALLIFSLVYCGWRAAFGMPLAGGGRAEKAVPGFGKWLLGALGTALGALAIRQFVPVGVNVIGLQLGYFAAYTFLFAVGIAAWGHDWLRRLGWKQARPWVIIAVLAWPAMAAAIIVARGAGDAGSFVGGFSWPAVLYACWEPLVAWGAMATWLLLFRERMNAPSRLWEWLDRRAYAAYILHPPVLVGIALALHGWVAPPLVKFAVTGGLTIAATWLVSDPFVRMPGLRRVL